MTILLAALHAFRTNKNFEPEGIYFFTFIIDLILLDTFL